MQPIPQPHVLDPDRVLVNDRGEFFVDHETRADLLDKALHESCAYAKQLWDNLDAARGYLWASLPPDPRSPGPHPSLGAHPTGADDEAGWTDWIAAFASVTSVLCGPHGDSGYGIKEARRAAELRRNAPNLKVLAAHPNVAVTGQPPEPPATVAQPAPAAAVQTAATPSTGGAMRAVGVAVLALLALRGLLPRRPKLYG